jgi:soluble lytic murein transglycosylase-like protein
MAPRPSNAPGKRRRAPYSDRLPPVVLPVLVTALATLSGLVQQIPTALSIPPPEPVLASPAPQTPPKPRPPRVKPITHRKPRSHGSAEQWRPLLEELGMDPATWLPRIHCESRGNPDAISPNGRYRGLAQIDGGPLDPRENLKIAAEMARRRGSQPWPTCG